MKIEFNTIIFKSTTEFFIKGIQDKPPYSIREFEGKEIEGCISESINNLFQALCIHPHDTESVVRLSTELAMYCMMNAYRAANWKCPVCGEGSINGMAVEHKDGCDYCEKKIKRMLKKEAN